MLATGTTCTSLHHHVTAHYAAHTPSAQEVWVKVCEVTPDERSGGVRIGGSMRVVDQSTGVDLDPTNLKLADGESLCLRAPLPVMPLQATCCCLLAAALCSRLAH